MSARGAVKAAPKPVKGAAEGGWETDPDVELMVRARDGDQAAFRSLFSKYSEPLLNFAYRFVGNRDRAEELVQDAFLQIYRARARYEPRARFATFLYRVTTNLCLNELRKFEYQGRTEPIDASSDEGEEGGRELSDDRQPTSDERLIGLETAGRMQKVLDRLPPNQKSALLLSRVEGLSYQEVADCLETSVSAVKSLIFRATQSLRQELRELVP